MRYMIFGESHGPCIGVVLEGVPAGLALDLDAVRFDLSRAGVGFGGRSAGAGPAEARTGGAVHRPEGGRPGAGVVWCLCGQDHWGPAGDDD